MYIILSNPIEKHRRHRSCRVGSRLQEYIYIYGIVDIPLPDLNGRKALFLLNLKRVDVAPDVDMEALAHRTEVHEGDSMA